MTSTRLATAVSSRKGNGEFGKILQDTFYLVSTVQIGMV
jgi:hypothetical protein